MRPRFPRIIGSAKQSLLRPPVPYIEQHRTIRQQGGLQLVRLKHTAGVWCLGVRASLCRAVFRSSATRTTSFLTHGRASHARHTPWPRNTAIIFSRHVTQHGSEASRSAHANVSCANTICAISTAARCRANTEFLCTGHAQYRRASDRRPDLPRRSCIIGIDRSRVPGVALPDAGSPAGHYQSPPCPCVACLPARDIDARARACGRAHADRCATIRQPTCHGWTYVVCCARVQVVFTQLAHTLFGV